MPFLSLFAPLSLEGLACFCMPFTGHLRKPTAVQRYFDTEQCKECGMHYCVGHGCPCQRQKLLPPAHELPLVLLDDPTEPEADFEWPTDHGGEGG